MLSINFYGLVFTGMEHSLHVLLVLVVACGLLRPELVNEKIWAKFVLYFSLFLLPLVRYEGLAISLPVLAYFYVMGDRKAALFSLFSTVLILIGFSFFLYSNDLGLLPSSVLAKTSHTSSSSIIHNLLSNIKKYRVLLVFVLIICFWKFSSNRALSITLISVTILHFLFGKHGWYGRYEIYYIAFVVVIGFCFIVDRKPTGWLIVFILPFLFWHLIKPTLTTPLASANIYNQQAQMAQIAKILNEKIAVNDLGLVALRTNNYVLDLWGLGSIEALTSRKNSNGSVIWISELMKKKGVEYAFVYDNWFSNKPPNWIKVADLNLLQKRITPASDVVALYATSDVSALKLRSALEEFNKENVSNYFNIKYYNQPRQIFY